MTFSRYCILLGAIVGALFAWRLIVLFTSGFGLVTDEAQYWIWSHSFAFGYFSKPPLLMWLISGASSICGDSESCIRLPSSILHSVTTVIVAESARRLWDEKCGLFAGVLYASAPGTNFSSLLITTDAPLLFFWALAMYGWICLYQGGSRFWWFIVGTAVGLGLLAKYAMGYFILSAAIHLLFSRRQRETLNTVFFPIGCLIAIGLLLPNILWNIDHGFVTFAHTAHIAQWHTASTNILKPLARASSFVGTQFGVAGPITFAVFFIIMWQLRSIHQDRRIVLLLCFSVPVLLLIVAQAAIAKAHGNWGVTALLSVVMLTAWWLVHFHLKWVVLCAILMNVLGTVAVFHYDALLAPYLSKKFKDPHARFRGWPVFAETVRRKATKHVDTVIVVGQRRTFSLLTYYLRNTKYPIVKWNPFNQRRDSFDTTTHLKDHPHSHYLMIVNLATTEFAKRFFCKLSEPHRLESARKIDIKVRLLAVWATEFRGYKQKSQKKCADGTRLKPKTR